MKENFQTLRSRVAVTLLSGALLLFALVLSSLYFSTESREDSQRALEAARISARVTRLLSLVQDSETSQRGYIITGNERYLAPFDAVKRSISNHFARLRRDLVTIATDGPTIKRLDDVLTQKIDEMQRTIDLKRAGRSEDAIAIIQTDDGKQLMDELRQILDRIEALAQTKAAEEIDRLKQASFHLTLSISVGAALLVILTGGVTMLVVSVFRQIEAARAALREQNAVLEDRVRARTAFLERANREIQSFAYIVSHDLKAPLVNISGFAAELDHAASAIAQYMSVRQEDADPSDPVVRAALEAVREDMPEALRFIRTSVARMDDLIGAILKLSRAGTRPLQPEPLALSDLINESVATLQHAIDADGATVEIETGMPDIVSDRIALQQIFVNLLDNAIKYADSSRPLVVTASARRIGALIEVTIDDNGRGIVSHDLDRIFDLFRRSGAQTKPGEGIGLAHVRTLCRRLGGDVSVASVLGRGSVFTLTVAGDLTTLARESGTGESGAGENRDDVAKARNDRHDRG